MSLCKQVETWIVQQAGNPVAGSPPKPLAEHAEGCPWCRAALQADRSSDAWLRQSFDDVARSQGSAADIVEQALQGDAAPRPGWRLFVRLAAAAVILLAAAWGWNRMKVSDTVNPVDTAQLPSSEWSVVFVRTEGTPVAVLQDLARGVDVVCKEGQVVGEYCIGTIHMDTIGLVSVKDPSVKKSLPVSPDQAQEVRKRIVALRPDFERGALDASQLTLLRACARLGYDAAVEMVYEASKNASHPYAQFSAQTLADGEKIKALYDLLTLVEQPDGRYRLNAVKGLAKIDSPLSRHTLRKIAATETDAQRQAAILGLAQLKDAGAVPMLEALTRDEAAPDAVRHSAAQALAMLLAESAGEPRNGVSTEAK